MKKLIGLNLSALLTLLSALAFASPISDKTLIEQYSLGYDQTCVVANGNLDCWAASDSGLKSFPSNLKSVSSLSAGHAHTCAIAKNQVSCWGNDTGGNLKVPPNILGPRSVASSSRIRGMFTIGSINCVLARAGSVCWGDDKITPLTNINSHSVVSVNFGESAPYICVGDLDGVNCSHRDENVHWTNEAVSNTPANLKNVTALASGNRHSCAIADNSVQCWGNNEYGQLDVPTGIINPREISAGNAFSCVIGDSGVHCWGDKRFGRLESPQQLANPRNLKSDESHSCVITDRGLKCWGRNDRTLYDEFEVYVPTGLSNVDLFNQSSSTACANTSDGLKCWGALTNNPKMRNVREVSSGTWHACALNDEGIKCWGLLYSWNDKILTPPDSLSNPRELSVGRGASCVIDDTGLKCWGHNAALISRAPTDLVNPTKLFVDGDVGCALTDAGVRCWGGSHAQYIQSNLRELEKQAPLTSLTFNEYENYGCGIANGNLICSKSMYTKDYPKDLKAVTEIASDKRAACAIHEGRVSCWGLQSIQNIPSSLKNPRQLSLDIAGEHAATACVLTDEGVKCWGDQPFVPNQNYSW